MIMRAKHSGNVIIFELEGHLDFETTQQFKGTCLDLMKKNHSDRIVFNLDKLKFVGSSGINQFIRVLKDLNSLDIKPRYCHLSSEFMKVFKAYQTARNPFEICTTEKEAVSTSEVATPEIKKLGRKKQQEALPN